MFKRTLMFKRVLAVGPVDMDHDGASRQWPVAEAPSHARRVSGGCAVAVAPAICWRRSFELFSSNSPRRGQPPALLITRTRSQPEIACGPWSRHKTLAIGSFLAQAAAGSRTVIDATVENVCAYKTEAPPPWASIRRSVDRHRASALKCVETGCALGALILDAKNTCDPETRRRPGGTTSFAELGVDAITLSPAPGQDIVGALSALPGAGCGLVTGHSSKRASKDLSAPSRRRRPASTSTVPCASAKLWAQGEQLLLEVAPAIRRYWPGWRQGAPERFRDSCASLGEKGGGGWSRCSKAGSPLRAMG